MPVAVRAWLRYLVPLTLLAVIACVPLWWIALRSPAAPDVPHARAQLRLAWVIASTAWACQLWLVAGAAPAVQSIVDGKPLSQLAAFTQGLRGLAVRAIPVFVAVLAIALGSIALVVPGLILLVLLSPTGAVDSHAEAVALARANWRRAAVTIACVIAGAVLIALACQLAIVPTIARKVAAPKLLPVRTFIRVLALALTIYAPLAACAIASITERRAR